LGDALGFTVWWTSKEPSGAASSRRGTNTSREAQLPLRPPNSRGAELGGTHGRHGPRLKVDLNYDFFLEWLIQNGPRDDTESALTRRAFIGEGDSGGEPFLRQKEDLMVLREAAGSLGLRSAISKGNPYERGTPPHRGTRGWNSTASRPSRPWSRGGATGSWGRRSWGHYIYNYDKVGPFTLMGSWE
jgi:hypothetical protein